MKLIDGDALVREISVSHTMTDDYGIKTGYEICMRLVEDAPTIKPERKTGRWLRIKGEQEYVCQECGQRCLETVMLTPRWNYCPSCGARMEGDSDEAQP